MLEWETIMPSLQISPKMFWPPFLILLVSCDEKTKCQLSNKKQNLELLLLTVNLRGTDGELWLGGLAPRTARQLQAEPTTGHQMIRWRGLQGTGRALLLVKAWPLAPVLLSSLSLLFYSTENANLKRKARNQKWTVKCLMGFAECHI